MERLSLLLTLFTISSMLKNASADDDYGMNFKLNVDPTEYFSTAPATTKSAFSFVMSKPSIGPVKPDAVDCQTNLPALNINQSLFSFYTSIEEIGSATACMGIKDGVAAADRFSVNNCKLLTQCAAGKTNKDIGSAVSDYFGIPKMMAEDYVNLQLQQNLKDMEKVESLRKFAEKKYGANFAPACKSIFNYDAVTNNKEVCDKSVMDNGFAQSQHKCALVKISCYNSGFDSSKEYSGFMNTFKPASDDESSFQNFFASKTDNQVNDTLTSDNEMLDSLATIISGKGRTNEKVNEVFAKLYEFKKQGKIDPVFGFGRDYISDDAKLYKKSTHYQFLAKALSKPMNMAQARSLIEKYRRDFAKETLGNTCPSVTNYADICAVATEIYKSKRTHVLDRKTSALIFNNEADDRYETLKAFYPRGIRTRSDFSIVMDASRCQAFDYLDITQDTASQLRQTLDGYASAGDPSYASVMSGIGAGPYFSNPYAQFGRSARPNRDDIIKSDKPLFEMPEFKMSREFVGPPKPAGAGKIDKLYATEEITGSLNSGMKEAPQIVPAVNNQAIINNSFVAPSNTFSNYATTTALEEKAVAIPADSKKVVSATASANALLNDRINEISKKLATSEANLARMQEEKAEAQAAIEHKKKVDDENKTITDLKEQLNDLKTQTAPIPNSDVAAVPKAVTRAKDNSSEIITRAPASESTNDSDAHSAAVARAPQESGVPTSAHSGGNYSGSESVSAPVASSGARSSSGGASSGGSLSTTGSSGGSGIVLTKTDSVSDAAIQDKILEFNNGQKFFIQEGDMVQEILPVIKDGKILLGDDGKPQFKRGKTTKKEKKSAREIAEEKKPEIKDAADLKRQEDVIRERVKYIKLKQLINGAVENQ